MSIQDIGLNVNCVKAHQYANITVLEVIVPIVEEVRCVNIELRDEDVPSARGRGFANIISGSLNVKFVVEVQSVITVS